jgi:hypothetical protein
MTFEAAGAARPRPEIRKSIRRFLKRKKGGPYSERGQTVSHICNHCVVHKIPFTLIFVPDTGYYLEGH